MMSRELYQLDKYVKFCNCTACGEHKQHDIEFIRGGSFSIDYTKGVVNGIDHFRRTCINCGYTWPQAVRGI